MDTLIIGIDGGEWDVIDPMLESQELPNLSSLIQSGYRAPLSSTVPPVSPPAWTSIQTGTNPGKHGIYDFSTFDRDYRRRSINASDRRATPFWQVLNDMGVSTGLFKVPFTYPPGDIDGFMVSGFPTPNNISDFAIPEGAANIVGSPERLFEDSSYQRNGDYDAFMSDLLDVADRQTSILLNLLDEYDTDLVMTVFDSADRMQHFFWKYFDEAHPRYEPDEALSDAIPELYRVIDDGIGKLLNRAGPETNVIVLSDHGFGPLAYDIHIDEWLQANEYFSPQSTRSPREVISMASSRMVGLSWELIKSLGLDDLVKEIILPETVLSAGKSLKNAPQNRKSADWKNTKAFFTTLSGQSIYINLIDRFSDGIVSDEEYQQVVDDLRSELLELRHPETGEKLIRAVYDSRREFDGWAVEDAPDLIVESDPLYTLKDGHSDSLIQPSKQYKQERSGDHRTDGILIASGPAFGEGKLADAHIMDIAPTLHYLHDCPIPKVMDGDVLSSVFADEIIHSREMQFTGGYGEMERNSRNGLRRKNKS
ncbi:alkaline phosphatase family protein [Halobacteriaceae archaeon GCM10025711]